MSDQYRRTPEELEEVASKYWSPDVLEREAEQSIVPVLLETQDKFISIIGVGVDSLDNLMGIISLSDFPINLFVKHLVILADVGGEMLKRINRDFYKFFPDGILHYPWKNLQRAYRFQAMPNTKLSNQSLKIDGNYLNARATLSSLQEDAIALMLFGSAYNGPSPITAYTLARCEIGQYLGKPSELETFVKQRYIWVSQIVKGAQANMLGQITQQIVADYLKDNLDLHGVTIKISGRLPNVTHTKTKRPTAFDIVVSNGVKYLAIEVSFQVTTNSTIERKSGQAQARYQQIETAGHRIAYVIDGAGNFERKTALQAICSYSHCTVAFSQSELAILCQFTREYFEEI